LYKVAAFHEKGKLGVVRQNRDEAIHWYRRAQAAGHQHAEHDLRRLAQLPPQRESSLKKSVYDLYPHLRNQFDTPPSPPPPHHHHHHHPIPLTPWH
jgi:TPR repeat protein